MNIQETSADEPYSLICFRHALFGVTLLQNDDDSAPSYSYLKSPFDRPGSISSDPGSILQLSSPKSKIAEFLTGDLTITCPRLILS